MAVKRIIFFALLLAGSSYLKAQSLPNFLGRQVTITKPEFDSTGVYPKGPAAVCVEGPPQRQCYTAPENFGRNAAVQVIQLDKNTPALFFSAATGGVSGWQLRFALLRPGPGTDLEDVFLSDPTLSNQGQYEFWNDPAISDAPIFVTADYTWGPDEDHYSPHRFIISAYVRKHSSQADALLYYLDDQYMTVRKYASQGEAGILAAEKQEILARLKRVKAEEQTHR